MPVKSNQSRLEKQRKLAERLVDLGYIKSYELYEDSHGIYKKEFQDGLHEDVTEWLDILCKLIFGSVLIDDIEDNVGGVVDNSERKKIRNVLASDSELYTFYESNKLQSSNLAFLLQLTSTVMHLLPNDFISDEKELLESIRLKFNGTEDTDRFDSDRYKFKLNNKEKREIEKEITAFVEIFILRFVK